jgi:hypothetical protein
VPMKRLLPSVLLLSFGTAYSQNIIIDSAWNSANAVGAAHNSHPCDVESTCTDEVRAIVHTYERELLALFAAKPECSGVSINTRRATNEREVVRGSEWWNLMVVISDIHEKTHWALCRNTRGLDGKAIAPTVESDGTGSKKEDIVNRVCVITKYVGTAYPPPGSAVNASAGAATSPPQYPSAIDTGTEKVPMFNNQITPHLRVERISGEQDFERRREINEAALTMWIQVLAWLTVVLALIAGVQAYMFIRQLKVTQKALRDSKEAADAAKASAEAAKTSADALRNMDRA